MVNLSVKPLMVGTFLAGFLNGSTGLAQNAASQPVQRLISTQEVRPVPSEDQTPSDEQIQLLRKDIRAQRKQLIAANMKLSGAEAEAINRTKYDLLKQYAASYDTMTDQEAQTSVGKWVTVDESVAQLRLKYVPIFRRYCRPGIGPCFFNWTEGSN